MSWSRSWLCAPACVLCAFGQSPPNPVVSPRGVVNAFTQQPAPSRVAPGGLLWVTGLNLGPAEELKAGSPWPLKLGEIEVLINGRTVPVGSASPGRIVVQVPYEFAPGLAQVVVRRGSATSRPARFLIENPVPSIRTADESGYGEPAAVAAGSKLTLAASGLGPTEPRTANGEAAANPLRGNLRVYVGGLPAEASATLSASRVGEFVIEFEPPTAAEDGDLVSVIANGRPANRTVRSAMAAPRLLYLEFPQNMPEIRALLGADLRGTFLAGAAARSADGCFDSWVFDLAASTMKSLDNCLVSPFRQAQSPFSLANENSAIAAFSGPAMGEAPGPISSKVKLATPGSEPMLVELPGPAENLASAGNGNLVALMADDTLLEIDTATGETRPMAGSAGQDRTAVVNAIALEVDLGDGLNHVLTAPVTIQQGALAVVVGDDESAPTRAKFAVVNPQGGVIETRDFPGGWVPLVPPSPPNPAGGAQVPNALSRFRVSTTFDMQSRTFFVLSRKPDNSVHGIAAFGEQAANAIAFPDGWFAASCSARVPFFSLELSRRIALIADKTSSTEIRNPCPGQGFLLLDIARQAVEAVPLPGAGQINGAQASEMNDYVYASNTDPSRAGRADTLYVLDGVTATAYRFDPPPDVATFTQTSPFPDMALVIAQATNRAAGDAGFAIFDFERTETRIFPTPAGFANVQLLGILPVTRKLIARGNKPDGSSLLVYDLVSGDLSLIANPPGVAWMGSPPQQAPTPGAPRPEGPGQQQPAMLPRVNPKANTVEAIVYDSERKQKGVAVLRVH